jgi:hypothetical protein
MRSTTWEGEERDEVLLRAVNRLGREKGRTV